MANQPPNTNPHFNISAAVVMQLGLELVSDEVTAVMELVKNSYDADASWVRIEVNSKSSLNDDNHHFKNDVGYIKISDDGCGMDEFDVKNGWMVISLSGKRKMKELGTKTDGGRTPLGDKGLGRLSSQRLGSRLEMITTKINNDYSTHIAFDWNEFTEDIPLTDVPTFFEKIKKNKRGKGTELIIKNLRDPKSWEGTPVGKFIGQLSQLIFPFKEQRAFHVFLTINDSRIDLDELNDALRSQAVSQYNFSFDRNGLRLSGAVKSYKLYGGAPSVGDKHAYQSLILPDNGKNFFSFLTDSKTNRTNFLTDINFGGGGILFSFEKYFSLNDISGLNYIVGEDPNENELADPGRFWGEIDDFNLREAESLDSTFDNFAQYKEVVKNQIGIRIFRNGFGIKPFGIDGYDWLKLGSGQTSGGSFYTLRPQNTIGFVALTADENKNIKEKTDREGFVDSPYSQNFFRIMDKIVSEINTVLEKTRRSYNDYKRHIAQQNGNINDIKESFERIQKTSNHATDAQKNSVKVTQSLSRISSSVRDVITAAKNTANLNGDTLKDLSLLENIQDLLDDAERVLGQVNIVLEATKQLENDANYIQPKIQDLENQLSSFSELAALGLTAEALSHEISHIVDNLLNHTKTISNKTRGTTTVPSTDVTIYVEYVKTATQSLRKQLAHLSPSLRYVRENKVTIDLVKYCSELADYYAERFRGKIDIKILNQNEFSINASKGKLTQILDNIILNSEYWVKEYSQKKPAFKPVITIEINDPTITIYDNGLGIDPNYEHRIFQPFVTSKPRNEGRGLGLFIVQQLVETLGGDILLLNERNFNDRKYKLQINLSAIKL